MNIKSHLFSNLLALLTSSALLTVPAEATLLLHSTMDDAPSIFQPTVATTSYATLGEAVPGPAHVIYEPGPFGAAARFDGHGFQYQWPVDGPVRFHGDNFDFDDPDRDGGRLDFWIKFNVDPHTTTANTWVARSNWGQRYINYELSGSPADLMVDVYSDIAHNERTNYKKFRVGLRNWSVYENIQAGEWHQITLTWRRNGGPHQDELHIYIDGSQEGCGGCNDYNGNLPPVGSITDFFFSPALFDQYILFSIDEVHSFDSWDVEGIGGNFADLQIPEGVTLTYPMDGQYPTWGMPVQDPHVVFEFSVVNEVTPDCQCDLYVDGAYVSSTTTSSQTHTEMPHPGPLAAGPHTYQVKCDHDRLVSPINVFTVEATTPTPVPWAETQLHLAPPSPNPFNGRTQIRYELARSGSVAVDVYDLGGRRVRRLVDGRRSAGAHTALWDGRDQDGALAASGTYYVRVVAAGQTRSQPVVRLR